MKKTALILFLFHSSLSLVTRPVAAGDWPNWRGPHCNGSAIDCGKPLVDSLADVKLLWKSEVEIPPGDDSVGIWFTGGYGSPIIYDGKAILQHFLPSGDVVDTKLAGSGGIAKLKQKHAEWGRMRPLVDADDVIHAFDMAAGKIVWEAGGIAGGCGYAGHTAAASENYLVSGGLYDKVSPEDGGKKVPKGDCVACLKIAPEGAKNIWALDVEKYNNLGYNSPAIQGDYAYVALGKDRQKDVIRVELATGKADTCKVGKQTSSTSVVMTDGRFLMLQGPGPEWMVDVSGSEMKQIGSADLKDLSPGLTPAVANGLVVLRNNIRLVCYDLRKQK